MKQNQFALEAITTEEQTELDKTLNPLNPMQRLFLQHYIGECKFNGTESARRAGYKGHDQSLSTTANRLLRISYIKKAIEAHLAASGITAHEVLARITRIAKGDVKDLLNERGLIDLQSARRRGKTYLIKKIRTKQTIEENGAETIYTELELYSAHEALRDLAKYHRLFTEQHELTVQNVHKLSDEQLEAIIKK